MDKKSRSFKEAWLEYKQAKHPNLVNSNTRKTLSYTALSSVLAHIFNEHEYEVHCHNLKSLAKAMDISAELLTSIERYIPSFDLCKKKYDYFSKFKVRNLEKFSFSKSSLILSFKFIFQISLPIIFITIRNFTIQKNLSISA